MNCHNRLVIVYRTLRPSDTVIVLHLKIYTQLHPRKLKGVTYNTRVSPNRRKSYLLECQGTAYFYLVVHSHIVSFLFAFYRAGYSSYSCSYHNDLDRIVFCHLKFDLSLTLTFFGFFGFVRLCVYMGCVCRLLLPRCGDEGIRGESDP
jgi:hypothetical protein